MIIFNHEPLNYTVILEDMLMVMTVTVTTTTTTTTNNKQQHSIGLHTQRK